MLKRRSAKTVLLWICFAALDAAALATLYWALPSTQALNTTAAIERQNTLPKMKPSIIRPNGKNYVPFRRIPKSLRYSVILLEDSRFYDHHGFDFYELGKAIRASFVHGKRLRGASTLSQQLVKNLYLSSDRSLQRKFIEALITIKLEAHVSKERILELYMNGIDWGRGLIGIRAAAQFYFGRPPEELTIKQSVFLAAIIPNPARFSRNPRSHFVQTRMMMALEALYRARIINLQEYSDAVSEGL
jgi:monofunctional biosynthetic peptidoglycan transglycosylase